MPSSIFVIDSSPAVRRLVEQISTSEGFEAVGFQDGRAALEAAKQASPSLIIADYNLDSITFSGFCKEINKLDHLTNTYVLALINPAEQPDENHLRSLGVKACLHKPVQSDALIATIKSLQPKLAATAAGTGLKRRAWPPAADDDDLEDSPHHVPAGPSRTIGPPVEQREVPPPQISQPAAASPDPMKGLFDQLLLAVVKESDKRLTDLLPRIVEEKLANLAQPLIRKEIRTQLGEILSKEQLAAIIHPLLSQELPALLNKELAQHEPMIRQTVSDSAEKSAGATLERLVHTHVEPLVHSRLPAVIREQVGALDQMVKDEIRAAVLKEAPLVAEHIVHATAEQSVEQSVQRVVPELAEQLIKAELKRLTASN